MSDERAFTPEIERLLAGELSDAEAQALRQRRGAAEIERLTRLHEAEQAALLQQRSPEDFARLVQARADQKQRSSPRGRYWTAGALAVGLALLALWIPGQRTPSRETGEERIKGLKPELLIYRQTPSGAQSLARGAEVRAHDTLQIAYLAAGRAHGVILSIDGGGAVTLHSPRSRDAEATLAPSGRHVLDRAYELDAAPAFERFFLVAAKHPIDVESVIDAARALARDPLRAKRELLALPSDYVQATFELDKAAP